MMPSISEKEDMLYESRCKRCGACCGSKGDDPCRNLRRDEIGRYYCEIYDKRYGTQFTASGKSFSCVPIKYMFEYRAPYENCGYIEAIESPERLAVSRKNESIKKSIIWVLGISAAVFAVIFTEGSLIVTTKLFGVIGATFIRVLFTIPLSWLVIYFATKTNKNARFQKWLEEKEKRLSDRARIAVNSGKAVVVFNTALFLGPIIASVLMLMLGIAARRIYVYATLCALLSAGAWSAFYGGMLCGIEKLFLLKM